MKVITLQENVTKGIVKTYVVNDSVSISQTCEDKLIEAGYTIKTFKPIPVFDSDSLEDDLLDYIE